MDDSFFGFDTTIPLNDDTEEGRIAEPSEEEYDALNDETFGAAINGDWEEAHEKLVRFGINLIDNNAVAEVQNLLPSVSSSEDSTPAFSNLNLNNFITKVDPDLELNLSAIELDNVDMTFENNDSNDISSATEKVHLEPAIWASYPFRQTNDVDRMSSYNRSFIQENHCSDSSKKPIKTTPHVNVNLPPLPPGSKVATLEDIERNLIIQQTKLQLQNKLTDDSISNTQFTTTLSSTQNQKQTHIFYPKAPPGFPASSQISSQRPQINCPSISQNSLNSVLQQHHNGGAPLNSNHLPPSFPLYPPGLATNPTASLITPHPLLNQHSVLSNFPLSSQRPLSNPHFPTALNNFALHPSFNVLRSSAVGMHTAALIPHNQPRLPMNSVQAANSLLLQQSNSIFNVFNMRLVQEIQQNHPLLQSSAASRQQNQLQYFRSNVSNCGTNTSKLPHNRRNDGNSANGNLPQDEFDEYANLMSTRDKHWLIGIQLSQLNTETPYIDDYYYTVYKERKALRNGNLRHSEAHKDNQLNHPLTQPKGHAQIILVQLGNKNGSRNGQSRERHNSENTGIANNNTTNNGPDQKLPYVFTPLKFENSLGKLQYGSVTAPRKIIDAEIMGNDLNSEIEKVGSNITLFNQPQNKSHTAKAALPHLSMAGEVASSTLRKSRHILLHIEMLYRYLLKLEDMENPNAIATIIMKKKKESERIDALEQLENANRATGDRPAELANPHTMNSALRNRFIYEIEPKEVLINKIITGLCYEKIVAMMSVRKGKVLIRRILPFINDQNVIWSIWIGVFSALQNVIKKDRNDADGLLYALYPEFKKIIKISNFEMIVNMSSSIVINDKNLFGIFYSRFGILSLVCMILRSEEIFVANIDETFNATNQLKWREFLTLVASALNKAIQNHTISAAIESSAIQPMISHFTRFKDLKLDTLLALITEAKQQID